MKKIVLTAVVLASLGFGAPVFAQKFTAGHESEYYCLNISVERIYPYRLGYVITYRKGINQLETTYLPSEWFTDSAGKGEMLTLPKGKSWPSLSIYYKNGEFSHARLYVHRWRGHQTWGNIPLNVNLDDHFQNVETIQLKY